VCFFAVLFGLTVFAIKKLAHRLPASFVRVRHSLALIGVHAGLGCGLIRFRIAARGAAIRKAGFVWLQFELSEQTTQTLVGNIIWTP